MTRTVAAAVALLVLGGCASTEPAADDDTEAGSGVIDCASTAEAAFPDVVDATVEPAGDGRVTVSATLCSAYDTPDRYADAWRVMTPDGDVLGVRELLHDHANEQPFTRSLSSSIDVQDGVTTLVVEGRDLTNGWGGATVEVPVP